MRTTNKPETPLIRVEISHDGQEVMPSVLDARLKVHRSLLSGRVTRIGDITFGYSWLNSSIRRIGSALIQYNLLTQEITSVAHDPRVQIYVRARPQRTRQDREET